MFERGRHAARSPHHPRARHLAPAGATAAFGLVGLAVLATGFAPRTVLCLAFASLAVVSAIGWRLGVGHGAGTRLFTTLRARWVARGTDRFVDRGDRVGVRPRGGHELDADAAATIADIERALGIVPRHRRDRSHTVPPSPKPTDRGRDGKG